MIAAHQKPKSIKNLFVWTLDNKSINYSPLSRYAPYFFLHIIFVYAFGDSTVVATIVSPLLLSLLSSTLCPFQTSRLKCIARWTQLIGIKLCIYDEYCILKMSSITFFSVSFLFNSFHRFFGSNINSFFNAGQRQKS